MAQPKERLARRAAALLTALLLTWGVGSPVTAQPAPLAATAPDAGGEQVIRITAKRFEYAPNVITVKRGRPVVFELTATDHDHGFLLDAFHVQADLDQGKTVRVRFIPDRTGTFEFHCDDFCGDFHDDMTGTLVVVD